ncbi:uncharacterized protein LOC124936179 [Impatiens glandulifera]|uniref:uncharacterized protein LOC124936179 n=1 Tax=Impatiens glandulifera TaxID=253017 RepID=UPI001FB10922|nr:uncharacterized protein LOC124936179 [Impatiens glandulifera]
MGQALRKASGKIRTTNLDPPSSSLPKKVLDDRPIVHHVKKVSVSEDFTVSPPSEKELGSKVNYENLMEEKDPQFDAMLGQLVGRIKAKPGGKLEMGEASIVEKYNRPLPKLRNTTVESTRYEERTAPPGTLNVAQLRHMMLLHQGKAEDHDGPMNVEQIAMKFQIDIIQVQNILRFMSLPPENIKKTATERGGGS